MRVLPARQVKARVKHRCTSCGEAIEVGEVYRRWASFDDGAFTNKMHEECLEFHMADHWENFWEYCPYSYERPNEKSPNEGA